MNRFRRGTTLAATTLALAGVAPVAGAAGAPTVTAAVQVTANPTPVRGHSAPQIVRHPKTGELVVVEADVRGDQACTTHISTDDGRSWAPGGELMVKPFLDCTIGAEYGAYASPAFASDGTRTSPSSAASSWGACATTRPATSSSPGPSTGAATSSEQGSSRRRTATPTEV